MRHFRHSLSRPSADELAYLYQDHHVPVTTIAGYYGVIINAVYQWLKKHGISIGPRVRDITRDELASLWTGYLTAEQVAQHLGIGMNTLLRRVKRYGLGPKMKVPRPSGPDCPTWKGGHAECRGPKPEWEKITAQVRHRDGYQCQRCALTEQQLGRPLAVHHKIPFDQFKDWRDANVMQNLVALCQACHSKVEGHPEHLPARPDPALQGITEPDTGEVFIRPMVCNPREVADLYNAGIPIKEIERATKTTAATVYRALRRMGIKPTRRLASAA